MYKAIIPLYIICFGLYIPFSRQPDFFDGEIIPAKIQVLKDSVSGKMMAEALYQINGEQYRVAADSFLKHYREGEAIKVICEASAPAKAAVYTFWGYWMTWRELAASIILPWLFLFFAKAITGNPTPEALMEEMEEPITKKRKYSD